MNWINAEHNLPVDNRPVLIGFKEGTPVVGFHDFEDNKTWKYQNDEGRVTSLHEVTHWMYLSKTPTENNEHYTFESLVDSLFNTVFTIQHLKESKENKDPLNKLQKRCSYELHMNKDTSEIFTTHPWFIDVKDYPENATKLSTEIGALHNFRVCIDESASCVRLEIR